MLTSSVSARSQDCDSLFLSKRVRPTACFLDTVIINQGMNKYHALRRMQEKSVREKKQKKEERKRRKAAAKAAVARAGGEQDEENLRAPRPARKSLSDWRGKFAVPKGGGAKSSAGDVSFLVGVEKVVVQKREAYGDKFYRQVCDTNPAQMRGFFTSTWSERGLVHILGTWIQRYYMTLSWEKTALINMSRSIGLYVATVVCGQVETLSLNWSVDLFAGRRIRGHRLPD